MCKYSNNIFNYLPRNNVLWYTIPTASEGGIDFAKSKSSLTHKNKVACL